MQAPPLGGSELGRGIKESHAYLRACVVRTYVVHACMWTASPCPGKKHAFLLVTWKESPHSVDGTSLEGKIYQNYRCT